MDDFSANSAFESHGMTEHCTKVRVLFDDDGKIIFDKFTSAWNGYIKVNSEVHALVRLNSNQVTGELFRNKTL